MTSEIAIAQDGGQVNDPFEGIDMWAGDDVRSTTGGVVELPLDVDFVNGTEVWRAAVAYHEAGLRVHPCTKDKRPLRGKGWQEREFNSIDFLKAPCLGIRGGPLPDGRHLVIIDVDVAKEGDPATNLYATLEAMEAAGLVLPPTLRASTPSGGQHYFYWSTDADIVGTPKAWQFETGAVDIRSDGLYVVAAPSPGYRFLDHSATLAELPAWVKKRQIEKVKPKQQASPVVRGTPTGDMDKRIRAYLAKCPPAIQGSNGSAEALKTASWIVRTFPSLSDEDVVAYMQEDWNARCEPPWMPHELLHKVESAREHSTRVPTEREPPPPRHLRAVPKPPPEPEHRTEGNAALAVNTAPLVVHPSMWVYESLGGVSALETRADILWSAFRVRRNEMSLQAECTIDGRTVGVTQCEKLHMTVFLQSHMPDGGDGPEKIRASQKVASLSSKNLDEAIARCAFKHRYNPVTEWLNTLLPWDGHDYIGQLADMIGDEHQARCSAFLKRWLIGTCMRAYEPGCIMDVSLWLWGNEGPGKSSLLRGLVHKREWFMEIDKPGKMRGNFSQFEINTCWILELPEVDQMRTPENRSFLKAWLTTPVDKGTNKNRTELETIERRFSVVGTTNQKAFAEGEERRWLPVHFTGKLDHEWLGAARPQLWAQVLGLYRAGESFRLNVVEREWHKTAVDDQMEDLGGYGDILNDYSTETYGSKDSFSYTELYQRIAFVTGVEPRRSHAEDLKIRKCMLSLCFESAPRADGKTRGFVRQVLDRKA